MSVECAAQYTLDCSSMPTLWSAFTKVSTLSTGATIPTPRNTRANATAISSALDAVWESVVISNRGMRRAQGLASQEHSLRFREPLHDLRGTSKLHQVLNRQMLH